MKKDLIQRMIKMALGVSLMSVSLYFMIQANIGVNPWDVVALGLSKTLGILYGTSTILIGIFVLLIDIILGEHIGIGTFIDILISGKVVDLLNWIGIIPLLSNIYLSYLFFGIGLVLMAISQYIIMKQGVTCGPRDSFQIGLSKKLPGLHPSLVLAIILVGLVIIGYFLGGPIGIGTLIYPFGLALIQKIVFSLASFDPRTIKHQLIKESWRILTK